MRRHPWGKEILESGNQNQTYGELVLNPIFVSNGDVKKHDLIPCVNGRS